MQILQFLLRQPSLILLNETLLSASVVSPDVPGYELIGRHEEVLTKRGVAVYTLSGVAPDIVLLHKSTFSERIFKGFSKRL